MGGEEGSHGPEVVWEMAKHPLWCFGKRGVPARASRPRGALRIYDGRELGLTLLSPAASACDRSHYYYCYCYCFHPAQMWM